MKKRYLPLLLALFGTTTATMADTPVKVTTITTNGSFADGTHWYYMSIGNQGFRISDNRNNAFITLGGTRRASADNVWCFVGNDAEGYMIYNMNAGTKKALAAPKEMKGNTGAEAYAHLMSVDNLPSDYTNRWDITAAPTSYGIKNGFYISEHGESSKTLNNRDRKLAFWSTGKDAGSTIAITPLYDETNVGDLAIDLTTGTFTSSNQAKTWHKVWTSNVANKPVITFSADNNDMSKNTADNTINMAPGTQNSKTATYTIASSAAQIMRYSFTVAKKTASTKKMTLTIDGKEYDLTSGSHVISVTLPVSAKSTSFKLHGESAAEEVKVTNFKVEYKADAAFTQVISTSTGSGLSTSAWASTWTSTSTSPTITLSTAKNNMKNDGGFVMASGSDKTSTYTIATNGGTLSGYTFKAALKSTSTATDVKITANGKEYPITTTTSTISVSDINATSTTFVLSGTNAPVVLTNFNVTGTDASSVTLKVDSCEQQYDLLVCTSTPNYRIPAIAQSKNGNLIAISDYRFSGADIGSGALDLRSRISKDNGVTWEETKTIADHTQYTQGSQNATQFMHTGFGDPCIVADRESNKVLLMSCTGNIMYWDGTRTNHQGIARFYSEDGGENWQKPEDISDSIYALFDGSQIGGAKTMFIGSGRICQSRIVKVKDYYRLYCSIIMRDNNSGNTSHNFVIYSDDFGKTWGVLGGPNVAPTNGDCDEPKAEELPDGSVICSSRVNGGRKYNIFRFTDMEKATGSWGSEAYSKSDNNGVVAAGNSCNGEVMVLPVKRNKDNKQMYLMLQSVPMGPGGRYNVGIYYKELESYDDFSSPANLSKDWDGHHQASYISSAYSTMTLQNNNTIGFLYEESTFGYDYCILYKNYSVEKITDGKYSYDNTVNRNDFVKVGVTDKVEEKIEAAKNYTKTVGCYTEEGKATIQEACDAYNANPCDETYVALNAAVENAARNESAPLKTYRIRNKERSNGNLYLSATSSQLTAQTLSNGGDNTKFCLVPGSKSNTYRIYSPTISKYIGRTLGDETKTPLVDNIEDAYDYRIDLNLGNFTAGFVCANPTNSSHPALHLATDCSRIVPWTTAAGASRWYIEDTDLEADMYALSFNASDYGTLYMPKSFVMPEGVKGGVVTPTADGIAIDYCYQPGETVPANTALLLSSTQGTIKSLPLINAVARTQSNNASSVENCLYGTTKKALTTVDGDASAYVFYKLSYGSSEANRDVLGFYWGKENGEAFTNAAYKAYLALPRIQAASAKRGFPLFGSEITGVNHLITSDNAANAACVYDLQGRKLNQIPSHGVYVDSNHKKHVVVNK